MSSIQADVRAGFLDMTLPVNDRLLRRPQNLIVSWTAIYRWRPLHPRAQPEPEGLPLVHPVKSTSVSMDRSHSVRRRFSSSESSLLTSASNVTCSCALPRSFRLTYAIPSPKRALADFGFASNARLNASTALS